LAEEDPKLVVFVVSDDPQVRDIGQYGFPSEVEIRLFLDSDEAFDAMRENAPDVVVVDLQTGNEGGFSLARDIRNDPRLIEIPVLILGERSDDAWLAKQGGATRYLLKPVPAPTLVGEVLDLASA
jgi:CheY-like chemotaxis protein